MAGLRRSWIRRRPARPVPRLPQYSGAPGWRAVNRTAAVLLIAAFCFVYGFAYSLFAPALLPLFTLPLALLGLLVVWALPDNHHPPVRPLEWLFFAFFASLALWPDYLAVSLPGLPWITMLRLTGFPMAFTLLLCASTSKDFRRELGRAIAAAPVFVFLVGGFVLIQLASIALSADKGFSIQKFIIAQTNWTAVFFIALYLFRKPGRLQNWAVTLWAMAIVVSLLAVWEFRLGHVPWAGHIPSFLKIEDPSVAKTLAGQMRAYTNRYRAQATFGTSLGLAEYLAFAMPFILELIFGRQPQWLRVAAAASLPLLLLAVVLTNARLGLIGCLMSFFLYGLVFALRRWRYNKSSLLGPAVALGYPALCCAAMGATLLIPRLHVMILGGGAQKASTTARFEQYSLGIPKILHNPFGYGIGMAAQTLDYHPFGQLTIDTYYISIALEYGVLGFIWYYGMVALAIFTASEKALRLSPDGGKDEQFLAPLAIALINFLVIKSVFSQQDNHPIVYMMMGAVVALSSRLAPVGKRAPAAKASPAPAIAAESPAGLR